MNENLIYYSIDKSYLMKNIELIEMIYYDGLYFNIDDIYNAVIFKLMFGG